MDHLCSPSHRVSTSQRFQAPSWTGTCSNKPGFSYRSPASYFKRLFRCSFSFPNLQLVTLLTKTVQIQTFPPLQHRYFRKSSRTIRSCRPRITRRPLQEITLLCDPKSTRYDTKHRHRNQRLPVVIPEQLTKR